MVHRLQLFLEQTLHHVNVLEGDGALLEVSFGNLGIDNLVDQVADAFFGVFRQTAGSSFHRVGHHQYSLFLGERIGTGIAELVGVYLFIGMFIFIGDIEIFCQTLAVVRTDEVADDLWQVMLFRQFQSVGHVADDDLGALLIAQTLVWIHTRLVFGEEGRIDHLADVVIQGACTYQLALAADMVGSGGSQVGHLQRMLEGTRSHLRHFAQQAVVDVRQFHQGYVRGETKSLLEHEEQGVGKKQQDAVDHEINVHAGVELGQIVFVNQFESEIEECITDKYDQGVRSSCERCDSSRRQ